MSLQHLVTKATDPNKLAIVCDSGESLTYGQLATRSAQLAGALRARGLEVGDCVAVLSENSPAYVEITWACRLAGLYYVTLNTSLNADEITYILNDSGAKAVVASASLQVTRDIEPDRVPACRLWLVRHDDVPGWESYDDVLLAGRSLIPDTHVEGDLLQYSSGTTGRPKGIKRPLRKRPESPDHDTYTFLVSLIGVGSDSIYLTPAPLYHSAPNIWTMTALRVGATVVLMKKFEPSAALRLIDQHRITHAQFVPTMFTRMLKLPEQERLAHDVSSLQGIVHAAAPCPVEIKRAMIEWWGPILFEYWSSSEGAGFTFITPQEWLEHPGSVGRTMLGTLHICDPLGKELPFGEEGTIWADGVDFNYLNDAAKDRDTTSAQGWRSVGDIGRIDEDGYLYLTDRASFMIISGGVNVYPQESENALIEHPRVYDAAVVGLPDEDLGEVAVAVVQPLDPADAGPELAAELTRWCEERLARYKCPRRVEFVSELPRSDTGKLFKRALRDQLIDSKTGAST